jgi:hypothetical protein
MVQIQAESSALRPFLSVLVRVPECRSGAVTPGTPPSCSTQYIRGDLDAPCHQLSNASTRAPSAALEGSQSGASTAAPHSRPYSPTVFPHLKTVFRMPYRIPYAVPYFRIVQPWRACACVKLLLLLLLCVRVLRCAALCARPLSWCVCCARACACVCVQPWRQLGLAAALEPLLHAHPSCNTRDVLPGILATHRSRFQPKPLRECDGRSSPV